MSGAPRKKQRTLSVKDFLEQWGLAIADRLASGAATMAADEVYDSFIVQ